MQPAAGGCGLGKGKRGLSFAFALRLQVDRFADGSFSLVSSVSNVSPYLSVAVRQWRQAGRGMGNRWTNPLLARRPSIHRSGVFLL